MSCSVGISLEDRLLLFDDELRDFLQFLEANARTVSRLHYCFLPNPIRFNVHLSSYHPAVWGHPVA
jgi:hypothetical protein